MSAKTSVKIAPLVFGSLWCLLVFVLYWGAHGSSYLQSFTRFSEGGMLLFWVFLGGMGYAVHHFRVKMAVAKYLYNGLGVVLLLLLLLLAGILSYSTQFQGFSPGGGAYIMLSINLLLNLGIVYFFMLSAHAGGALLLRAFPIPLKGLEQILIRMGLGVALMTGVLFFLGWAGQLKAMILLPILLIAPAVAWRESLELIKSSLLSPFEKSSKLNFLGYSSFLLILIFTALNLGITFRPFPVGWDALSVYMNLSSLVAQHAGLVSGFQPYNWSLFMSMGYVFGMPSVALLLSLAGSTLSLLALFVLSRKWLDLNASLLVAALFFILPSVQHQCYADMKVDLGALFIQLLVALLFLRLLKDGEESPRNYFIGMGLLAGFAFGIKLTSILVFLAVPAGFFAIKGSNRMGLGSALIAVGLLLLLKLDAIGGLRDYHQYVPLWGGLALCAGAALCLFGKTEQDTLKKYIPMLLIYTTAFLLPFLPWVVNNYSHSREISMDGLLYGKSQSPVIDADVFRENWMLYRENQPSK